MSRQKILKKSALLGLLTLASRILGLARERVMAGWLGTTHLSDAFTIAFLVPNLLRRFFAEGNIAAAFVPTFKGYLVLNDKEATKRFLSAFFTFGTFVFTLAVVLGVMTSPFFIQLLGPNLYGQWKKEGILLTRVMFPYLGMISLAAMFQGILNTAGVFAPSGATPILFNVAFIGSAVFLSRFFPNPARAMAVGVVIGGALQMLFQLPFIFKRGFSFSFVWLPRAFTHTGTKKVLKLIAPTVIGMGAYQIGILATTRIANIAGEGGITALRLSNRLMEFVLGIFSVSVATVLLTELSGNVKENRWDFFNQNIQFALKLTALIAVPITLLTVLFPREIVAAVFQTGKFNQASVQMTAGALFFHIMGLYFITAARFIAVSFYANEDTRSPTIAGMISLSINVLAAYSLVLPMKVAGVALAASIGALMNLIGLFLFMRRNEFIETRGLLLSFCYLFKVLAVGAAAIVPVWFLKTAILQRFAFAAWPPVFKFGLPLAILTCVYGAVYFILLLIIRDPQLKTALFWIGRRLNRNRKS